MTELSVRRNPQLRELRVCHLIDCLQFGGAEKHLVMALNNLPVSTRFAIFLRDFQPETSPLKKTLEPDVRTYSFRTRQRHAVYDIWRVARLLRSLRVDVVHTHLFWSNFYGTVAASWAGIPVIVTTDHGIDQGKNRIHRWIERNVISKNADLRFCVSHNVLASLRDESGVPQGKLAYMPNGIELPPSVVVSGSSVIRLGSVGRFVREKDYATLVRAVALLIDGGLDVTLCLVGDGPLREEIRREARIRGIESRLQMPGFQSNVSEWLVNFDIFVMSSVSEGQPLALLEAMACGLPIVATDVGGIPETLKNGRDGLLVKPKDPQELARAIGKLVASADLRSCMAANARSRIVNEFSIDAMVERYLEAYERVLRLKRTGVMAFKKRAKID